MLNIFVVLSGAGGMIAILYFCYNIYERLNLKNKAIQYFKKKYYIKIIIGRPLLYNGFGSYGMDMSKCEITSGPVCVPVYWFIIRSSCSRKSASKKTNKIISRFNKTDRSKIINGYCGSTAKFNTEYLDVNRVLQEIHRYVEKEVNNRNAIFLEEKIDWEWYYSLEERGFVKGQIPHNFIEGYSQCMTLEEFWTKDYVNA